MTKTLYFYDLETSGIRASEDRIMQFGGQRTDLNLNPIGEPDNYLIKLTEDVLPYPEAILLTGITPQATLADGLTEVEFLKIFHSDIATPDTIFVGYNNVRFDDEFIRYMNYRNFYDPYEWHWSNGRSRWDFMDVIRMTRALRPEGIKWPNDRDGKPSNRLELLTRANNISHDGAHDALSDVRALIDLAKLLKTKQPKLFSFLFEIMRDKAKLTELISSGQPFVYTSGKYTSDFAKTTAVAALSNHPTRQGSLVFDLRYNPEDYAKLSVSELVALWLNREENTPRLPVMTIQYNRLPAVAPLSVLDQDSQDRLKLSIDEININFNKLKAVKDELCKKILEALEQLDEAGDGRFGSKSSEVDERLYEKFLSPADKSSMTKITSAKAEEISNVEIKFSDDRLNLLLPLYKARNFSKSLSTDEVETWQQFKKRKLLGEKENSRLQKYFNLLSELGSRPKLSTKDAYIIEELKLYGESIVPLEDL